MRWATAVARSSARSSSRTTPAASVFRVAVWVALLVLAIDSGSVFAADTVSADRAVLNADALVQSVDAGRRAANPPEGNSSAVHLVVLLTIASLAPAIVLTCTCFARFAIVFSFLRNGLATQGAPPNQVLVGLALFMTLFVMSPTADTIYANAVKPYLAGEMSEAQALEQATPVLRRFLLERTRQRDLMLFYEVSSNSRPTTAVDVPLRVAVPAFVLSELTTAFKIGLVILLPFLVVDLIVASILSSLGMVMLPPPIVSLPIKLLVFVAVDGWHLMVSSLLRGVL